jgi:hypothetical protein
MELTKFLGKNQTLQLQIQVVILKITSCRTMCNVFMKMKQKIQDFTGKTNCFLGTLPFNLGAILATWLDLGAPQKLQEKMNLTQEK